VGLGANPSAVSVCYNGVETDDYSPSKRIPDKLLSVARFVEKKGPLLTLKAFSKIHAIRRGAKLVMVGDGPLLSEAKAFVSNNGLEGSVEFLGACPREETMAQFLTAAVFLQHSITAKNGDTEGFGITLVEAMASGIPVVATRHNGFVETVEHGRTGFLVPEFDVQGMAEATLRLLNSPELGKSMGLAGRERAQHYFSNKVSNDNLRKILALELLKE
jgi:glycosyltransferase involved in cell wall biosynthesis